MNFQRKALFITLCVMFSLNAYATEDCRCNFEEIFSHIDSIDNAFLSPFDSAWAFCTLEACAELQADKSLAQLYEHISYNTNQTNPEMSLKYAYKGVSLFPKAKDTLLLRYAVGTILNYKINNGRVDSIEYYSPLISLGCRPIRKCDQKCIRSLSVLSDAYAEAQLVDSSVILTQQILDRIDVIKADSNLSKGVAGNFSIVKLSLLNNLASMFDNMRLYDQAYIQQKRARLLTPETGKNQDYFYDLLTGNMINTLTNNERFDVADSIVTEVLANKHDGRYPNYMPYIATLKFKSKDFDKAIEYFSNFIDKDDPVSLSQAYIFDIAYLASCYSRIGDSKSASKILNSISKSDVQSLSTDEKTSYYTSLLESKIAASGTTDFTSLDSLLYALKDAEEASRNETILELNEEYEEKARLEQIEFLQNSLKVEEELSRARLTTALTAGGLLLLVGGIGFLVFSQKRKADSLNKALEKKTSEVTMLNRELNHRTSNQISLAYELILDQRRQIGDEQAKASLERSESQLMALREVNRALAHRSDDLVRVDEVLTKVAENLQAASPHPFTLDLQLKEITVHGNAASRSALILSELMSNSIKYAFPNTESPAATISLSQTENETSISYLDNGPGTDGTVRGTGVGSGLIEAMLEDLDAEWEQITGEDGSGYGMRWWWR